jgi:Ca2+-binding EF-hand superfamily protein
LLIANCSGVIDYSQFVALMAKVKSKPMSSDAEIRSAFEVLDKKKTGIVKVDELRHLLTKVWGFINSLDNA